MRKNMRIGLFSCIVFTLAFIVSSCTSPAAEKRTRPTVTIGIVESQLVQDLETNYYILWLEKKTGLNLEFVLFPKDRAEEYLDMMFKTGNVTVDAFFTFPGAPDTFMTSQILQEYAQQGHIIPLTDYIQNSEQMKTLFKNFTDYTIKTVMTSPDGNIYYMPSIDTSIRDRYPQILWINESWLKKLNLPVPQTTQALREVLTAFKTQDPNGNGLQDEIPLAGSLDTYSLQSFNFIINAFIYNDPYNSHMVVNEGRVDFAPLTPSWRAAVQYLHDLYNDQLLHALLFTLDAQQLVQLANDPRDLLGTFSSANITDVLLQSSPEVISNFIRIAPISGPDGTRFATVRTPLPAAGGIITTACKNPDAVFHLFELMLSEEAFLVGQYGEERVDWAYAKAGDIDLQGRSAKIEIKNQLSNKVQNKHILQSGPFFSYTQYADRVTWNGLEADQEYMNARAYYTYSQYLPKDYLKTILIDAKNAQNLLTVRNNIDNYTEDMLQEFIQGKRDPYDDAAWTAYLDGYTKRGIATLIAQAQRSYSALWQN